MDEKAFIDDAKKKRHNESVKRYMRKRSEDYKRLKEGCLALQADLAPRMGELYFLSDQSRRFLEDLEMTSAARVPPLLSKLFNGIPKPGDYVTAREAMERIYKSRVEMNAIIKRWRSSGIHMHYEPDPEGGALDARYVMDSLPRFWS